MGIFIFPPHQQIAGELLLPDFSQRSDRRRYREEARMKGQQKITDEGQQASAKVRPAKFVFQKPAIIS
jgi:hypothetical protein